MRSRNLVLFTISLIVLTSVVVYSADAAGIPKKAISTVARFLESDLPTTTVFTDQASTYTAGKQTFVASSSSSAGVNIPTGSDPTTPAQGDIWLNSDTLKYFGTSTHSLITSAITSINSDTNAAQTIQGVSGNTTASTSAGTTTINTGSNVVVTGSSAQTITKGITMNSLTLGGAENANNQRITSLGTPTASTDADQANHMGLLGNKVVGTCPNTSVLKYQSSNSTWICQTLPDIPLFFSTAAASTGTVATFIGSGSVGTTETVQGMSVPSAGHLKNLYAGVVTTPGAGKTDVFIVSINGVTTSAPTCTISAGGTSCSDLSTAAIAVNAGDRVSIKVTAGTTTIARASIGFEP